MTIEELAARHRRIALDANAFIYLFEAGGPLARATAAIVDVAESGRISIVVSSLALAEIGVGPVAADDATMAERYGQALCETRGLDVVPLTANIALDVAVIRGRDHIEIADAVHLATARHAGASAIVTNDERMRPVSRLEVVRLADLVA
jgi:predicted nucleic acid-binding protein